MIFFCFQSQGVDGFVICAGLTSQYCLLNYESGQFTDLFPIDTDNTMPIVKRISKVSQNEHCLTPPGLEVIKLFSCSTQLSMKLTLLIHVKMPTNVGLLTFISEINKTSLKQEKLYFSAF